MAIHRIKQAAKLVDLRPYVPSPTAKLFHASDKPLRGVMGPVGAGKSVMCIMELFSRALEQAPSPDGVRRTRFILVRNTFPQLTSTTLKTVMDWIPPGVMQYSLSAPVCGLLDQQLSDGTRVHSEWIFLALDTEADIGRLKSLEYTMVYINEASEIPKEILDEATARPGRYPPMDFGGPTFKGVIFDTNPPEDDHWIYKLAEVVKPSGFQMWKQPPALIKVKSGDDFEYKPNPEAENIQNLHKGYGYYLDMVNTGKDPEWIKVNILGQYGSVVSGRPVYPEYDDNLHLAKGPIDPLRALPLVLGWDFGLNASCVFGQLTPGGCLNLIAELTSEEMGIQRFVREMVKPFLKNRFPDMTILGVGDPAGSQRSQTTEQTCMEILAEEGFSVEPAVTNEFVARKEAVSYFLTKLVNGKPAFQLAPECDVLRKGFLGHYRFRRMKVSGGERYTDRPEKNFYSHVSDACQYLALYFKGVQPSAKGLFMPELTNRRREIKTSDFKGWS